MECNWPTVKLEELLEQNTSTEKLEPNKSYRLLGVRLEGKGPFIREEKPGSQVRAKSLRKVTSGEFIYSRLFAWRGAFGLISPEMDCAFVSNEFPTFKIDETRVFPKFLEMYFKQRWIWNEVEKYCTGTTKASRNRFKEKFFLNLDISLPAKEEQKHIVARIESLLAKIEEARRLRGEAVKEAEKLFELFLRRIFLNNNQYDLVKLGDKDYFELNPSKSELSGLDDDIDVSFVPMTCVDPELGKIKNFGIRKLFEVRKGYTYFKEGDVLFAKITPCMENGNVAIAQNITNGIGFGTTEFHVVRVLEKVLPKWVYYLFRTKGFRDIAKGNMTGTAGQRRVPKSFLEQYEIPLPSLPEQRRIVTYLDSFQAKVDELKRLQAETEKEIEELVPSILDKAFKGEL
ncbi:restriction endonuclease subunit S [Methanophagales archaeon]|nr:MAG: restriction endonuclease subunit S [Methanophagales archaeon]